MKRWRCPTRPLLLIALLLLAGAVVNVAVAWVCAGHPRASLPSAFGCVHRVDQRARSIIDVVTVEAGWPMRALGSTTEMQRPTGVGLITLFGGTPPKIGGPYLVGPRAPMWMTRRSWFRVTNGHAPIHPLPGFAINTLFYAIALGAILALPLSIFPIRRHLRARRGRCPKCGYDRTGLADPAAPCPECGATR